MGRPGKSLRRSWLRRLLLGALLSTLVVVVLVAFGWFPQEPLRRFVESQLRATIGPQSAIRRLHVVPRHLRADIDDLVVEGPGYRVEVPHARVTLTWALVLGRALSVRSLEAQSPRILIRPAPETAKSEPFDQRVVVENLLIRDGTITYRDPSMKGDVTLQGIEARGSIGEGALELTASGGSWARPEPVLLGPASARLNVSPDLDVTIDRLEAGTSASRFRVSGQLGNLDEPKLDLKVEAALDLADGRHLPAAPPMQGRLDVTGRVSGKPEELVAQLTIGGNQVRVQDWNLDRIEAHLDHTAATPARSVAQLSVDMLGGHAQGKASLSGETVEARVELAGLHTSAVPRKVLGGEPALLGTVSGELNAQGELDRTLRVQGKLRANGRDASGLQHVIAASGEGTAQPRERLIDIAWRSTVDSQPARTSPALPRLKTVHVAAEGTARGLPATVNGKLRGRLLLEAEAGPLEADAHGSLQWRDGAASVRLDGQGLGGVFHGAVETRGDFVRSLSVGGKSLDIGALLPQGSGRLAFDLEASGPTDRLSGTGQAQVEDLSFRAVDVGTVSLGLNARDGRGQLNLHVPDLNVSGQGQLEARARSRLRATVQLQETPLGPLAPLMPQGRSLEGLVSAKIDLDVPLEAPRSATAEAVVESAEIVSDDLSAHTVKPFNVDSRNRRVTVRGLEAEGMGAVVRGSGSIGLDAGAAMDANVQLGMDLTQLPVPQQWRLAGRADAEARLLGSARKPSVSGHTTLRNVTVVAEGSQVPLLSIGEGRVNLAEDRVAIPGLDVTVAGGSLHLTAEVPLAAVIRDARVQADRVSTGETARVQASWNDIEAAPLTEALQARRQQPIEASLSGEAQLSGGLTAIEEVTGAIRIPQTSVRIEDQEFQIEPVSLTLERGRVTTSGLTINSPVGTLRAEGQVDLVRRTVDASSHGQFDLRALSPFLEDAALLGQADVDIKVSGSPDAPRARGTISVEDAALRLAQIRQAVTDLKARIVVDDTTLRVEDASALLGGGTVTVGGSAKLAGLGLSDIRLDLAGRDIALRYPADFKTRLRADLSLTGRPEALLLGGKVVMERGFYDKDIHLEEQFMAPSAPPLEPETSALLQTIALDIETSTENPVRVRNNLAELEATGSLRVRGDANVPAPFGRLEIREAGKVILQGREFTIQSGTLFYNGSLDPEISLRAQTLIRQVDADTDEVQVTIVASGPLMGPHVELSSDPSYSQPELVSLVATGRLNAGMDSAAWVAGEQAALLFTSRLSRSVSRAFMGLGFDEVVIQPELIAREAEPGARFTFGKRLTSRMKVVYSTGLNDPEARFIQGRYRLPLAAEAKVQRDDEGRFTYGAGQKFRWGSPVPRRRPARVQWRRELSAVRLEGDQPLPEQGLRAPLRARPGKKVSYWNLLDDGERLQRRLVEAGYIEALVSPRLDGDTAVFDIRSGDHYRWRVEGLPAAPDLTVRIRSALHEEDALERGRAALLEEARRRGHLRARVETQVLRDAKEKTLVFEVDPGPAVTVSEVSFPGANALSHRRLLQEAGGAGALVATPKEAQEKIKEAYRRQRYLSTEVGPVRVFESEDGAQARIVVPIREGPEARIASVLFEGSTKSDEDLKPLAQIEPGARHDALTVTEAVQRMRDDYFKWGYASARITPKVIPTAPDLDLVFQIVEGDAVTIGPVVITGLHRTRESLVRRKLELETGEALDPRKLVAAERRLLELGLFSRVSVSAASDNPATIKVELEERGPYHVAYDVRFSRDERATTLVDTAIGNIAGRGIELGGRYRIGRDIRELRGSFHLPAVGRAGDFTASVFRLEEDFVRLSELGSSSPFPAGPDTEIQQGFQLQQKLHLRGAWDFLYGYRFKRLSGERSQFRQDLSSVEVSLARDRRDNALNARRGNFWSVSLELGPTFLRSDFNFFRAFGQAFLNRPLSHSLTWAQGYRLGLANGLDRQRLAEVAVFGRSTELFRAGGANSLRGFATDSVGPKGPISRLSAGGEATLILNQELRYQHSSGVGAAVFYDAGNVFAGIKDFDLRLRHSIGAGLRYDSPVGLLRLDVGFPLGRKAGEASYQWFLSFGQAF